MDRNNLVAHIYADYVAWCKSHCIKPETFTTFYTQLENYTDATLEQMRVEYNWLRMMEEAESVETPFLDLVKRIKKDVEMFRYHRPPSIQPNDEERAVAEVVRMLGGEG